MFQVHWWAGRNKGKEDDNNTNIAYNGNKGWEEIKFQRRQCDN